MMNRALPLLLLGTVGALRQSNVRATPALTASRVIVLRGGAGGTAPAFSDAAPMASAIALHSLCLAGCGYGVKSRFGMGAAALLFASAGLTASGNFPAYMAGVHVALLLQAGAAATFTVQTLKCSLAQLQGAKMCSTAAKLVPYAVMSASSVGVLGAMQKLKPKKANKVK